MLRVGELGLARRTCRTAPASKPSMPVEHRRGRDERRVGRGRLRYARATLLVPGEVGDRLHAVDQVAPELRQRRPRRAPGRPCRRSRSAPRAGVLGHGHVIFLVASASVGPAEATAAAAAGRDPLRRAVAARGAGRRSVEVRGQRPDRRVAEQVHHRRPAGPSAAGQPGLHRGQRRASGRRCRRSCRRCRPGAGPAPRARRRRPAARVGVAGSLRAAPLPRAGCGRRQRGPVDLAVRGQRDAGSRIDRRRGPAWRGGRRDRCAPQVSPGGRPHGGGTA